MRPIRTAVAAMSALTAAAALAVQAPAPLTIAAARQSLVGQWQGKLEYRDYQADKWFGLPVKVRVSDGGATWETNWTMDFTRA